MNAAAAQASGVPVTAGAIGTPTKSLPNDSTGIQTPARSATSSEVCWYGSLLSKITMCAGAR
ncbi:hypothetical protein [Gordonia polyisoprenivorans]|uniref:hypothetical protein n=1 Tax=Gordonia polyisoprenivorans TaxID=84595 RepID=UPI0020119C23|nr:hypothetical protein [Gordonia polyisoprenivorans]